MNITQLLFSFQGRIRRLHYWLAGIGAGIGFGVVAGVIMAVTGASASMAGRGAAGPMAAVGGIVLLVLYVALLWVALALQVKRWHDRDKGWVWIFINFIPLVGPIWTLVECGFMDGTQGPNKFGPSPKGIAGPAQPAAAGAA